MMTLPSLPISNGSIPSISQAAMTASSMGMSSSLMQMPTEDFSDHSFRRLAKPPLVGSFMDVMPPTFNASAIKWFSGAASLFTTVSKPYPSLKDRRATPWFPMGPDAMMTSLSATPESFGHSHLNARDFRISAMLWSRCGERLPIPLVFMNNPSAAAFSTTLVSPVTILTPADLAVEFRLRMIVCSSSVEKPSCMTIAHDRAMGVAPMTDRSLTVPATARRPMSPPGKNSGLTV